MTGRQTFSWTLILLIALAIVSAMAVATGSVKVPLSQLASVDYRGIVELRIARVLLGILAGAGLAVAGAVFQAVLRNPLAEPYVLGVSSGAGFGAAMVILSALSRFGPFVIPAAAFLGALGSMALVYNLARVGGRLPIYTLLLAGVIVNSVLSSLLMFLVSNSSAAGLHNVMWWLLGNLQVFDWRLVWFAGGAVILSVVLVGLVARDLNVLSLGEEPAAHLGLRVERTRKLFFIAASLMTGAVVSVCGLIGFVGLIVPHTVRLLAGPDHRSLIPLSAISGAIFLVLADAFARTLMSTEIPVGVITAFVGGPFFIYLLRSRRRSYWV